MRNFQTEIKWLASGAYAISETVSLGERVIGEYEVGLSGYASRCGDALRYFGNYKITRGGQVICDQRGLDVGSFSELLARAQARVSSINQTRRNQ